MVEKYVLRPPNIRVAPASGHLTRRSSDTDQTEHIAFWLSVAFILSAQFSTVSIKVASAFGVGWVGSKGEAVTSQATAINVATKTKSSRATEVVKSILEVH
jgi:hypothetical protein